MTFGEELAALLNKWSMENMSNTPDFILADYLTSALEALEDATLQREDWYGHRHKPGQADPSARVAELTEEVAELTKSRDQWKLLEGEKDELRIRAAAERDELREEVSRHADLTEKLTTARQEIARLKGQVAGQAGLAMELEVMCNQFTMAGCPPGCRATCEKTGCCNLDSLLACWERWLLERADGGADEQDARVADLAEQLTTARQELTSTRDTLAVVQHARDICQSDGLQDRQQARRLIASARADAVADYVRELGEVLEDCQSLGNRIDLPHVIYSCANSHGDRFYAGWADDEVSPKYDNHFRVAGPDPLTTAQSLRATLAGEETEECPAEDAVTSVPVSEEVSRALSVALDVMDCWLTANSWPRDDVPRAIQDIRADIQCELAERMELDAAGEATEECPCYAAERVGLQPDKLSPELLSYMVGEGTGVIMPVEPGGICPLCGRVMPEALGEATEECPRCKGALDASGRCSFCSWLVTVEAGQKYVPEAPTAPSRIAAARETLGEKFVSIMDRAAPSNVDIDPNRRWECVWVDAEGQLHDCYRPTEPDAFEAAAKEVGGGE